MRIAFAVLVLYCCAASAAEPFADARKLLTTRDLYRARAEEVLRQVRVRQGLSGWEERVFLFAELALKTDMQTSQEQVEQVFQLLAEKAMAPWKQRGEIGLRRLGAIIPAA